MTKKTLFLGLLAVLMMLGTGCSQRHRAILTVPPPVVPQADTVQCVHELRHLSRWGLTPPLVKVVAHNNNAAFVLFKVNGCRVVERNAAGKLLQVYTMPGQDKVFDLYSFSGEEVVIRADAFCPVIPSHQQKGAEAPVYVPGTNPPAEPANKVGCSEGQYLGTDEWRTQVYPGYSYFRTDSWTINYPSAVKIGVYR